MGERAKVRVWLTAIEYTGGNVGSDTEFAITINGQTVLVSSDIKDGTRKGVDKLLLEDSADDNEAKVAISVKVVEEDVLVDDVGQSQAEHQIVQGWRRQALPPLHVTVQENKGVLGMGATAVFILHFDAEFLATSAVVACRWNGKTDKTRTLANYYGQTQRHRRMADYIAGACAYFNLQAAVGHAMAAIEDGMSSPKKWVEDRSPSANWMQLSLPIIRDGFLRDYWQPNNATGLPNPDPDDVFRFDVLNAVAGIWYLCSLSPGDFRDEGRSYKSAMFKAMQYNWGPEYSWPADKAAYKPQNWGGTFKPSAYAWTMAFLAWGNGYAAPDTRYTSEYAKYARTPVAGSRTLINQDKRLSPLLADGVDDAQLAVPDFLVDHVPRVTPYGRRSQPQSPRNRQIVLLARKTGQNTDHDYISALTVAVHIAKAFRSGVAPVVTADTYFACESMKHNNAGKSICVIALGAEAKSDVAKVFPSAHGYSNLQTWLAGTDDGYVDAAGSARYQDNYRKALDEALAAYRAGY